MTPSKILTLGKVQASLLFSLDLFVSLPRNMVNQEIQSPYKRGGDDGLTFGAYLTVMFFSGIFSQYIPGANLVSSLMMLGVPAVTYFYLRRYFIKERGRLTVSALWMHGIVTFACGSLLAAFLMFIYMRWKIGRAHV